MTIEELRKTVGMPYRKLDENGKALGCMLPVYLLYPEIPRYDWPHTELFSRFLALLKKHGQQVEPGKISSGDVLAFHLPLRGLHIGIYLGGGDVIHCGESTGMETFKFSAIARRIEGVFRWTRQGVYSGA